MRQDYCSAVVALLTAAAGMQRQLYFPSHSLSSSSVASLSPATLHSTNTAPGRSAALAPLHAQAAPYQPPTC